MTTNEPSRGSMFGFSRDEMRSLGSGTPEQRPQSTVTTSSGLVSPPPRLSPAASPAMSPSELEGSTQAAILEWQQAHNTPSQPTNNTQMQTSNGMPTAHNTVHHPDYEAPMIYPEPTAVPPRPTSTAPPTTPFTQAGSPPPMPTLSQSQWLAQQHQHQHLADSTHHLPQPQSYGQGASSHAHSPPHGSMGQQGHTSLPQHASTPAIAPLQSHTSSHTTSPTPQQMHQAPSSVGPGSSSIHSTTHVQVQGPQVQQLVVNANGQPVIRPTTPAAPALQMQQQSQTPQPSLPPGYTVVNGQVVAQHPASNTGSHIPVAAHLHPQQLASLPHGAPQHAPQHATHLPISTNAHGHLAHASSHMQHAVPGQSPPVTQVAPPSHIPQPTSTPAPGSAQHHGVPLQQGIPQGVQQHQQMGIPQQQEMQQQPVKQSKWKLKPSKKPVAQHRPSISSMSVTSSISSASTDIGSATTSLHPPAYHQVVQQPQAQVQMQMQVQSLPIQPQQHISALTGQTATYPWKCSSCAVGLSPQNVYHECLICSSADLASKLCQTCYTMGANNNTLPLHHDKTYYICNKDPTVITDTAIPPQKWTIKQNQFGRKWYQSCSQPVKTHIRPMTATIPNHSGWIEAKTKVGNEMRTFWVNAVTGESSWQRPPTGMPKGWREVRTPEGKPFYVNDTLELATWVYPGHQPPQQAQQGQVRPPVQATQSSPVNLTMTAQAQAQVQPHIVRPQTTKPQAASPQIVHAPQPIRPPVPSTVNVIPPVNSQGQVQVNIGSPQPVPVPQQQVLQQVTTQPLSPQSSAEQQAAKQALKNAGKQLSLDAVGGFMTAGLRMVGMPVQSATAVANGVVNVGKAGVNVRRASRPSVQQQPRPAVQATYSSDGSVSSSPLFTPQSPAGGVSIQQQMQGQYFASAHGQAVPQPVQQQPAQVTNVQNIQNIQQVQQVQQVQQIQQPQFYQDAYGQQQGSSLDVNIGNLQIGDSGQGQGQGQGQGGNTTFIDNSNTVVDNSNNSNNVVDTSVAQSSAVAMDNSYAVDTSVAQSNAVAVDSNYTVDSTYVSQGDLVASPDATYTAQDAVAADSAYTATDSSAYVAQDTIVDQTVVVDASTDVYVDQSQYMVADQSQYVSVDQSQYVSVDQSQYMATDSTDFTSTATGPVPTDLSGYSNVDQSSYGMVDMSSTTVDMDQTAMASSSLDASYAYDAMAQQGQENSLGLIDDTQYETVSTAIGEEGSGAPDLC